MPCEVISLQLEVHDHKLSWSVVNVLHIKLITDIYMATAWTWQV